MIKQYQSSREKRQARIRAKIKGTANKPRLSVFRSNKYLYGQLIDDISGKTLVSEKSVKTEKTISDKKQTETKISFDEAYLVGQKLANKALKKGIKAIVFDRSGYRYHGRIKALAEGARSEKLEF